MNEETVKVLALVSEVRVVLRFKSLDALKNVAVTRASECLARCGTLLARA